MAKVTKKAADVPMAYSMKKKEKVQLFDGVASENGRGSYIVKGTDEDGNNISAIMSKTTVEAFVESGQITMADSKPKKKAIVGKK